MAVRQWSGKNIFIMLIFSLSTPAQRQFMVMRIESAVLVWESPQWFISFMISFKSQRDTRFKRAKGDDDTKGVNLLFSVTWPRTPCVVRATCMGENEFHQVEASSAAAASLINFCAERSPIKELNSCAMPRENRLT